MGLGRFVLKSSGLKGIAVRWSISENLLRSLSDSSSSMIIPSNAGLQIRSFSAWKGAGRTSFEMFAGFGRSSLPLTLLARGIQVEADKATEGDAFAETAGAALQAYLQKAGKIYLSDAMVVVEKAPSYVTNLAALARQNATTELGSGDFDFRKQVEKYLKETGANVLEPVLESIGVVSERLDNLRPKLSTEEKDVQALLFIIRTFHRLGVSRHNIGQMIERELKILCYTEPEIQAGVQALRELQLSEDEILSLIQKYPLVLRQEVVNNIAFLSEELSEFPAKDIIIRKAVVETPDLVRRFSKNGATAVVKYLSSFGISESRLNQIFQNQSRMVCSDVEKKLKLNVEFLKVLGISRERIGKIINRSPRFCFYSLQDNLTAKLEYFKSLSLGSADFAKMVIRYPAIFSASLENKIKPAVAELRSVGLSNEGLKKVILYRPLLFGYKLGGDISELVKGLHEYNGEKRKVTAFIKLFSRGADQRKRCEDCLVQNGLSRMEAKEVLDKEPGILGYNEQGLSLKIENLTKTLGIPIQNIVKVPEYMSFPLRKRILRRQRVLAYLKAKGLLSNTLTLKELVAPTNKRFCDLYVKSHPEGSEVSRIWFRKEPGVDEHDCLGFIKSSTEGSEVNRGS